MLVAFHHWNISMRVILSTTNKQDDSHCSKQFVNMLCSIWRRGLNVQNIVLYLVQGYLEPDSRNPWSGFRSTGFFPVDEAKYKLSRLDKLRLVSYSDSRNDDGGDPIIDMVSNKPTIQLSRQVMVRKIFNNAQAKFYTSKDLTLSTQTSPKRKYLQSRGKK